MTTNRTHRSLRSTTHRTPWNMTDGAIRNHLDNLSMLVSLGIATTDDRNRIADLRDEQARRIIEAAA